LNWKSRQHHQTSVLDVFRFEWVVELLRTVRDTQTAGFAGMLSVLYVADQPVAVHLGARTNTVAHIWYPAFDTTFGKYSPGLVLLTELARALSSLGVRRLDFGPGPQQYKQRFKSGEYPLAIGVVDSHRAAGVARHASRRAKAWVRQSALRGPVRIPAHMLFRFRQWLAFR
jgi:CelD/BcsL family acetyltransferase involved in cellulose biosynthesis